MTGIGNLTFRFQVDNELAFSSGLCHSSGHYEADDQGYTANSFLHEQADKALAPSNPG